jgi:hypothetical protein
LGAGATYFILPHPERFTPRVVAPHAQKVSRLPVGHELVGDPQFFEGSEQLGERHGSRV